ncbi:MAG TPA: flagellar motor stator protein MotA [Bacilli bacterium]|nr:flagellar motor stator protein MotA [Bacilli bacterium]
MEKSTIIGLILGVVAVVGGMILKGAGVGNLINPAAIVIILVGTVASVSVAFPMSDLKNVPNLFKIVFSEQKLPNQVELIETFKEWASISRREGLLALESKINEIDDPFLRNGMRLVIDGNEQDFVRDVLMADISAIEERHKVGALIFSQAGMYAPTLGVLGAVIGLIAALSDMSNIDLLAAAIAAAFVATLLGIFTGYVLWHPMSNKLRQLSKKEIAIRHMMIEGVLSIQSGVSTIGMGQKLSVFLTPSERKALGDEEGMADA